MKTKAKKAAKKAAPAKPATKQAKPAAKPQPAAKAERVKANGITYPKPGSVAGRIWAVCDKLQTSLKRPPARFEVITETAKLDPPVNQDSVSMQYFTWRKFHGVKARSVVVSKPNPAKPAAKATPAKKAAKPAPAVKTAKPAAKPASKPAAAKKAVAAKKQTGGITPTSPPVKKASLTLSPGIGKSPSTPAPVPTVPKAPVAPPAPPMPPKPPVAPVVPPGASYRAACPGCEVKHP